MNKENDEFDFQKALKAFQEGQPLTGKEGVLTPLIKRLTEAALEGEMDSHLGREVAANRRNGKSKKCIKSFSGNFELSTPRDRSGTFSPQIVKKHQTTINDEIEQKILALYGHGMSYKAISAHIEEIYGIEISTGTLSAVTDKIIHTVKQWQARPLEAVYPIVWMDAIHYKIRENGKVQSKAIYTILGVTPEGHKEVLGLYISENEGEVECISKGKVHKRYEFGCKVSVAATSRGGWFVGAKAFHGNPYDGHTLADTMDQVKRIAKEPLHAFVDRGYRGHDYRGAAEVHVDKVRRGRTAKSLWRWMKRRAAIEPGIGHLKREHRMDRNRLKGTEGDMVNAILSAAGMNFRKLLKWAAHFFGYILSKIIAAIWPKFRLCCAPI